MGWRDVNDDPDRRREMGKPEYGDSHEERVRELTETGVSIRRSGKGILQALREALAEDDDANTRSTPSDR